MVEQLSALLAHFCRRKRQLGAYRTSIVLAARMPSPTAHFAAPVINANNVKKISYSQTMANAYRVSSFATRSFPIRTMTTVSFARSARTLSAPNTKKSLALNQSKFTTTS